MDLLLEKYHRRQDESRSRLPTSSCDLTWLDFFFVELRERQVKPLTLDTANIQTNRSLRTFE